ncbi:DUF1071 domain-containing protein [Candidatus Enterococcus clewellii]|uniref:SSAP RNA binding domain-containing protein n=1 Tax=Candidatus Enterococcus clewellii TaxID=1834193 RepID=A0A242K3V9_9ENTE|nr:DUF1071 domain-containing protein [Enterococcus sp. 9E7_DIV0242]OTP13689.1 hypothetical protein A5888_003167 [Enterococcus sp. 9E7_DIV0242]
MAEKKQEFEVAENHIFNVLYQIDVKNVVEKKNNLTYLSWAWAWAEVCKRYPDATYKIERDEITKMPYLYDPQTGYMVFTQVTIKNQTHEMWLPVMDSANKAMKDSSYTYKVANWEWDPEQNKNVKNGETDRTVEAATMFDINKALMRCLVKNLAMFGLGLYIYAGEDMPEDISMLDLASERSKKIFHGALEKLASKYEKTADEALTLLTETAKITADDFKWTKGDLGTLKRGMNWLEEQYKNPVDEQ